MKGVRLAATTTISKSWSFLGLGSGGYVTSGPADTLLSVLVGLIVTLGSGCRLGVAAFRQHEWSKPVGGEESILKESIRQIKSDLVTLILMCSYQAF